MNLSDIKQKVREIVEARFDHKNLNVDTPPFDTMPPTVELVARQLLSEVTEAFDGHPARPVACHVQETATHSATAYADGRTEVQYMFDFSAARQTRSPHLSDDENRALFGKAASEAGHGHHYYGLVTMSGTIDETAGTIGQPADIRRQVGKLRELFDHKHLNKEVPELRELPMTTECLTRFMFDELSKRLPVTRVRLRENDWFFCEYTGNGLFGLGVSTAFSAMHRLHSLELPESQNAALYGKCNNPRGHGHYYSVEMTLTGPMNEKSGTLFPLDNVAKKLNDTISPLDNTYLDQEVDPFRNIPSSGEHIVLELWKRLEEEFGQDLSRVRLGETNNNRFAVRRAVD